MESTWIHFLQAVIGIGILNVWLVRPRLSTAFRGGDAKNLVEEFAVYGFPSWFCYMIGAIKISLALVLLYGLFEPTVVPFAAWSMAAMMLGAVTMHAKVGDRLFKSLPAFVMLSLSLILGIVSNS